MDTLDGIFFIVFLDINNGLEVDIVAKSVLTTNFENGSEFATGMLPRPVGTDMNGDTASRRIKGVAIGGAVFVLV